MGLGNPNLGTGPVCTEPNEAIMLSNSISDFPHDTYKNLFIFLFSEGYNN